MSPEIADIVLPIAAPWAVAVVTPGRNFLLLSGAGYLFAGFGIRLAAEG